MSKKNRNKFSLRLYCWRCRITLQSYFIFLRGTL